MIGLIVILLSLVSIIDATSIAKYTVSPKLTYQSGARVCDITNYAAGSTDLGVALRGAFSDCVIGPSNARRDVNSPQVVVMIPAGNYTLLTTTTLRNGYNWFLHFNGCYITYQVGGYPLAVQGGSNLVVSGDVAGTMDASKRGTLNGEAYLYPEHGNNLRLFRVQGVQNVIIGRLVLVQSPAFHLVVSGSSNVEIFETLINGPSYGGTDGMDIDGTNIHVHDCQVHNKDECVTLKSGTRNVLVERIFCDGTGGSEFGSFGEASTADPTAYGASIENVVYNNIYTVDSNVGFYMKGCTTNNGLIRNVTLTNFIIQNTAYPFGIDYYWMCNGLPQGTNGGGNLTFTDIRISNFLGTMQSASARPVIKLACGPSNKPGNAPTCTNIKVSNISVWGADGSTSMHNYCDNAVGSGACLSFTLPSGGAVTQTYTAKVGTIPPPSYGLIQYPLHQYPVYTKP